MLVLLFLTIAMPNTTCTTPLHLLPNNQIFTCIPTLSRSILLAGPPSTFIIAVRMVGATKVLRTTPWQCRKQCSRDGQPFGCAVPFPLLHITLPSFLSLSPPPHHCSLLPITVPSSPSLSPPPHHCPLLPIIVPSFPSLSPPSHHCPLLPIIVPSFLSLSPPPHHCPLLPITVPSFLSLSPPSHHCPLLPITVPSSSSLSPPSHHCLPPPYSTVPSSPSRPLLPITVPSSHHCPLLPTTVPSSPSLSPPPHHIMLSWQILPPPPPIWSVKKHSSGVLVKCTDRGGLPAVQVPGSVGTAWYGPGIGPTLMNNVAWTASHPPGDKLKWKALCGHLMPTEYADYVTFVFGYVHV